MPNKPRVKISKQIEADLLFKSDHTCCICNIKNKDVVFHHIDQDTTNNKSDNLAVVCSDCHSKISGNRGLGRAYSRGEVIRYKRAWEKRIQDLRKINRPKTFHQKELISQIDIMVCEILCTKNRSQIEKLFDILYEINLWRGNRQIVSNILEGFEHLAVMGGLSSPIIAEYLADKTWELCWHFVGPEDVPMGKKDLDHILRSIGVLDTLIVFISIEVKGRRAMDSIALSLENFMRMSIWYSKDRIQNAILKVYKKGFQTCVKNKFFSGYRIMRRSLKSISRELAREKRPKKALIEKIDNLIQKYKPNITPSL